MCLLHICLYRNPKRIYQEGIFKMSAVVDNSTRLLDKNIKPYHTGTHMKVKYNKGIHMKRL